MQLRSQENGEIIVNPPNINFMESLFFLKLVKVKSTTVQGSRNHPRENVKANIVIGNIPVANGVVHLIDKPLIIVASPLWDYLQEEVHHKNNIVKAT